MLYPPKASLFLNPFYSEELTNPLFTNQPHDQEEITHFRKTVRPTQGADQQPLIQNRPPCRRERPDRPLVQTGPRHGPYHT